MEKGVKSKEIHFFSLSQSLYSILQEVYSLSHSRMIHTYFTDFILQAIFNLLLEMYCLSYRLYTCFHIALYSRPYSPFYWRYNRFSARRILLSFYCCISHCWSYSYPWVHWRCKIHLPIIIRFKISVLNQIKKKIILNLFFPDHRLERKSRLLHQSHQRLESSWKICQGKCSNQRLCS